MICWAVWTSPKQYSQLSSANTVWTVRESTPVIIFGHISSGNWTYSDMTNFSFEVKLKVTKSNNGCFNFFAFFDKLIDILTVV